MITKWEYFLENKYYIWVCVLTLILGFGIGHAVRHGVGWAIITLLAIVVGGLVAIFFGNNMAYKRYVEDYKKYYQNNKNYTATRTDMINMEEDD